MRRHRLPCLEDRKEGLHQVRDLVEQRRSLRAQGPVRLGLDAHHVQHKDLPALLTNVGDERLARVELVIAWQARLCVQQVCDLGPDRLVVLVELEQRGHRRRDVVEDRPAFTAVRVAELPVESCDQRVAGGFELRACAATDLLYQSGHTLT